MLISLCVLDNTFSRAVFAVILLISSAYTWYTTQNYAINTGYAKRLAWKRLKSDLWLYFKPTDYAY